MADLEFNFATNVQGVVADIATSMEKLRSALATAETTGGAAIGEKAIRDLNRLNETVGEIGNTIKDRLHAALNSGDLGTPKFITGFKDYVAEVNRGVNNLASSIPESLRKSLGEDQIKNILGRPLATMQEQIQAFKRDLAAAGKLDAPRLGQITQLQRAVGTAQDTHATQALPAYQGQEFAATLRRQAEDLGHRVQNLDEQVDLAAGGVGEVGKAARRAAARIEAAGNKFADSFIGFDIKPIVQAAKKGLEGATKLASGLYSIPGMTAPGQSSIFQYTPGRTTKDGPVPPELNRVTSDRGLQDIADAMASKMPRFPAPLQQELAGYQSRETGEDVQRRAAATESAAAEQDLQRQNKRVRDGEQVEAAEDKAAREDVARNNRRIRQGEEQDAVQTRAMREEASRENARRALAGDPGVQQVGKSPYYNVDGTPGVRNRVGISTDLTDAQLLAYSAAVRAATGPTQTAGRNAQEVAEAERVFAAALQQSPNLSGLARMNATMETESGQIVPAFRQFGNYVQYGADIFRRTADGLAPLGNDSQEVHRAMTALQGALTREAAETQRSAPRGIGEAFSQGLFGRGFGQQNGNVPSLREGLGNLAGTAGTLARYQAGNQVLYGATSQLSQIFTDTLRYQDTLVELQAAQEGANAGQIDLNQSYQSGAEFGLNAADAMEIATRALQTYSSAIRGGADASEIMAQQTRAVAESVLLTGQNSQVVQRQLNTINQGFGLGDAGQGVDRINDSITNAVNFFGGSKADIQDAVARTAAPARLAGMSPEQTANVAALIGSQTGNTGGQIASDIERLISRTGGQPFQSVLARFDVPNTGDFLSEIQALAGKIKDKPRLEQQQIVNELGANRNLEGLTALIAKADQLPQAGQYQTEHQGQAAEDAAKRVHTLHGEMQTLAADFSNMATQIGQSGIFAPLGLAIKLLEPGIHVVNDFFQAWNQVFTHLPRGVKSSVVSIAELAAVLLLLRRANIGITQLPGMVGRNVATRARRVIVGPTAANTEAQGAQDAANATNTATTNENAAATERQAVVTNEATAATERQGVATQTTTATIVEQTAAIEANSVAIGANAELTAADAAANEATLAAEEAELAARIRATGAIEAENVVLGENIELQTLANRVRAAGAASSLENRVLTAGSGGAIPPAPAGAARAVEEDVPGGYRGAAPIPVGRGAGAAEAEAEAARTGRLARAGQAARGAGAGAAGFLSSGTGIATVAIVGAMLANEIRRAAAAESTALQKGNQTESAAAGATGPDELRASASDLHNAAGELRKSSAGFFGWLTNNVFNGDETGKRSREMDRLAEYQNHQADREAKDQADLAAAQRDASGAVDLTSPDNLNNSLTVLQSTGHDAADQMDSLIESLNAMADAAARGTGYISPGGVPLFSDRMADTVGRQNILGQANTLDAASRNNDMIGGLDSTLPKWITGHSLARGFVHFGEREATAAGDLVDKVPNWALPLTGPGLIPLGVGKLLHHFGFLPGGGGNPWKDLTGGGADAPGVYNDPRQKMAENLRSIDFDALNQDISKSAQDYLNGQGFAGGGELDQNQTDALKKIARDKLKAKFDDLAKNGKGLTDDIMNAMYAESDAGIDKMAKGLDFMDPTKMSPETRHAALQFAMQNWQQAGQIKANDQLFQTPVEQHGLMSAALGPQAAKAKYGTDPNTLQNVLGQPGLQESTVEQGLNYLEEMRAAAVKNGATPQELKSFDDAIKAARIQLAPLIVQRLQADAQLANSALSPLNQQQQMKNNLAAIDQALKTPGLDKDLARQLLTLRGQTAQQLHSYGEDTQKAQWDLQAGTGNDVGLAYAGVLDANNRYSQDYSGADDQGKAKLAKNKADAMAAFQKAAMERENARRQSLIDPRDSLGQADETVREDHAEIDRLKQYEPQNLTDRYKAEAKLAGDLLAADKERVAAVHTAALLTLDMTNPAQMAQQDLKEAQDKLKKDSNDPKLTGGARTRVLNEDTVDVRNKQSAAEEAAFSQEFEHMQTADQLGEISHQAYMKYLEGKRDRIKKELAAMKETDQGFYQKQQDLDKLNTALKGINDSLQGQFNIGQIDIPTVYEMRRTFTAGQANQGYSDNRVVTITVNGGNSAEVLSVIKSELGTTAQSRRAPTTLRRLG